MEGLWSCLKRDFQDLWDFQDCGTCDESHYYKQEGESQESGIGVPSYSSEVRVCAEVAVMKNPRSVCTPLEVQFDGEPAARAYYF